MVSALLVLATGVTALVLGPVSAQAAPASPGLPDVTIQATTTPLSNNANSGTATTVTASCPSGSTLVGGGGFLRRISSATDTPGNGLKLNGTLPSDATGNSASPTTSTPVNWAAVAGFGGQSDIGDQASAFADCVRGPTTTRVVVSTPVGVATQGNAPLKTTATCPSGTRLLSGGALGVPPSQPSFKPIASYPSDVAGNPVATAALNPMSWSAYGSAGVSAADEQVTAYALCATDATVNVQVTRVDAPGPQTGSTFTTTTATCATGRLLGGGVLADQGLNVQPQQGVHLRGSYPSDTTGAAVPNQASNPTSWSGAIQAGGQDTPGTQGHVFAMCAIPTSTPTPSPTPVVSPTPMVTPTPEPPPVMTPTPVVSPTPVVTPTPTSTPSPSPGPGATVTATTLIVIQLRLLGLDGLVIPIGYVMPVNAAGTVQFKDGATDLGRPVPVVAGIALGPVSILNAGQHSLSAIFTPSNPTRFQPSVSNTVTLRFLAAQW